MLAQRRYRCYIDFARLWRASGVIISPGPYRSFRELSLAGSVDPVIWCPPTFVGNSGIERSNGHCGFAPLFLCLSQTHPSYLATGPAQTRTMTDPNHPHAKAMLRAAALAKRDALSDERRAAAAQAIAQRGLPVEVAPGTTVAGYSP